MVFNNRTLTVKFSCVIKVYRYLKTIRYTVSLVYYNSVLTRYTVLTTSYYVHCYNSLVLTFTIGPHLKNLHRQ